MNRSFARGAIYNNLSYCYTYPNEEVCSWLMNGRWMEEIHTALIILTEKPEGLFPPFEGLLAEKTLPGLGSEYARLFNAVAPPYGSAYFGKDGLVPANRTSELCRLYHEARFTLKKDMKDFPDHIVHELEYMGILAGQEGQASGRTKIGLEEMQMNFFSRYLLPWVSEFCKRVAENSRSGFYLSLSLLTGRFINLEKDYLGVPEELK
ncbi:MAG: molecular chaperone TorD family protein [Deltaproteobacteria bacterium]|nr:molecular chaperone TorD family protein [Deltaproteobacteria bacterium]